MMLPLCPKCKKGNAKDIGVTVIDQLACDNPDCDFKTNPYWDGMDLAEEDWKKGREERK